MVFANMQIHDKEAFFALLDEYFDSRPNLFAGSDAGGSSGDARVAAATAVGRSIAANPAAAANFGKRVWSASNASNARSASETDSSSNDISQSVGRVAAASLALQNRNREPSPGPPPMPSRTNSSSSEAPPAAPPRRTPSQASTTPASGLVSRQGIGKVDTSSKMNALVSSFGSKKAPPSVAAPAPSAFANKKNAFAPPPVRRVTSDSSPSSTPPAPPARKIAPPPEPEPEPEEEEVGEWADVLYDYSSNDPGDLNVKEGERIVITERTSEDWWTAELNGKTGLVPASYVKIL